MSALENRPGHFTRWLAIGLLVAGCSKDGPKDATEEGTHALLAGPQLTIWVSNPSNPTMMELAWTDVQGEKSYTVERQVGGNGGWRKLGTLAADQTSYQDYTVHPSTGYCYRVRPVPDKIAGPSNTACETIPIVFEAESLQRTQSGGSVRMVSDNEASGGELSMELDLGQEGWVEFEVPIAKTGVYHLFSNYELCTYMGQWEAFLDGQPIGTGDGYYRPDWDEPGWIGFSGADLGDFEVTRAPTVKRLKFHVIGQQQGSDGYVFGIDTVVVRPSGLGRFEAESLRTNASHGSRVTVESNANASNGKVAGALLSKAGSYVEFSLPVQLPGDFLLGVGLANGPAGGMLALTLDGESVPDGVFDTYSQTAGVLSGPVAAVHIATTGAHTLRFTVTGKNPASNGFALWADYVELGRLENAACVGKASGSACSDGNKCTLGDVCQRGLCVEGAYRECPSPRTCQVGGYCDWGSGECVAPSQCSTCGNGVVEYGEECDDGNLLRGDGCNEQCLISLCGDGVVSANISYLSLTYLARATGETQGDIYFTVNGVEVARATLPVAGCEPGIQTLEVTNPALLAAVKNGENVWQLTVDGDVAWAYYTQGASGQGWVASPLLDAKGGDDLSNRNPDLCGAGYDSFTSVATVDYWPYNGGEECDDGNDVDNDGCSNQCKVH